MNRIELLQHIKDMYSAEPEYLWEKYPAYAVFRHAENRKWFAALMTLPREKLGLRGAGEIDVLNVKCDPILVSTLRHQPGYLPAYHMNKDRWVTICLDGTAADDDIRELLDMSFELTKIAVKKPRNQK